MRMQRRFGLAFLAIALLLAFSLTVMIPVTFAIGEVTPTPAENEPAAPPATMTPLPRPSATPAATTAPDTNPALGGDVEALLNRALEELQAGQFADAIDTLTEVVEIDPDNVTAYTLRGAAYAAQNNYQRAIDDFTRALAVVPYDWAVYVFRADTYANMGEPGEAMFDYDKALELNPRYVSAYQSRAAVHQSLGQTDEAELDTLMVQGITQSNRGAYRDAVNTFSDVIALDGGANRISAYAYYNQGLTFFSLEDYESAIEDFTQALEIYPDMHDSYLGRGIAYRIEGDTQRAGADFLRRIEILEANTFEDTLAIGDAIEIEMAYGNVYRLTFEGNAGDVLDIEARMTNPEIFVDPLIVVLDPDGNPIAGDDDFGGNLDSLLESVELTDAGTYTVIVSHANGGFDGAVRVLVSESNPGA